MAENTGYMCFKALYNYLPQADYEIELKINDEMFVQKPVLDFQGWLFGVNMRSRQNGQFPGTYCSVLSFNAELPRPPKKHTRTPTVKLKEDMIINEHKLEKILIIKPVFCKSCNDFIWGGNRISLVCKACLLYSHTACHQLFLNYDCGEEPPVHSIDEIKKQVEYWSPDEVLEWMAAARLHPCIPILRDKGITGKDLYNITEQFLKEAGITFDLHARIVKECIDELLAPPPTAAMLPQDISLDRCTAIDTHDYYVEHTFTTYQCCDVCGKLMFGIFRQGFMCGACGIQCHRPCSQSMPPCNRQYMRGRRASDSSDPAFCCNYNSDILPPVMRKCIEHIEQWMDTNTYIKNVVYEEVQALRSALNQNAGCVNMDEDLWRDPSCAAYVLKSFLLELPFPIIPTEYYDNLISLAATEEYTNEEILDSNTSNFHLNYLLKHIVKMSSSDITLEQLADIFSIYLMRPAENEIENFIANLDAHSKVITMLLRSCESKTSKTVDLEQQVWFWPNATRRDVSQCMHGKPDGYFLVRPSEARIGEWTLTVRKGGKDRLIKIIQRNGRYGFRVDLLKFSSFVELIQHFQVNSLKDYNEQLDIILEYPCPKPDTYKITTENTEEIKQRYIKVDEKLKELKRLEFLVEEKQQLWVACKTMNESQTDVVSFIEEQINLTEQHYAGASSQDRAILQASLEHLNRILHTEKTIWQQLDNEQLALKHEFNTLNTEFTEISTEIPILNEEYDHLELKMKEINPNHNSAEKEEDEIYDVPSVPISSQKTGRGNQFPLEDLDDRSWLFGRMERNDVKRMLENKPNGTFLVRESDNYPYAISLVHNNAIKHVPILKGPSGYGFAEPHNIYSSLHDLINHYHSQSLRLHNRTLDTTLQFPYRYVENTGDEQIYE